MLRSSFGLERYAKCRFAPFCISGRKGKNMKKSDRKKGTVPNTETKEETYVVKPLIGWFQRQKANWEFYRPSHGTSATGWDLEVRRKNQDLLVEAKFIDRQSFLGAFAGLVVAPLANRPQRIMKTKDRSWCHEICWAIGIAPNDKRDVYQMLFDCFARNPIFWNHYCKDLRLKYVYFVRSDKVARVKFAELLDIAVSYSEKANGKKLLERRAIANELMEKYKYD